MASHFVRALGESLPSMSLPLAAPAFAQAPARPSKPITVLVGMGAGETGERGRRIGNIRLK